MSRGIISRFVKSLFLFIFHLFTITKSRCTIIHCSRYVPCQNKKNDHNYFVKHNKNLNKQWFYVREGRGAMARARSFANVTACRAVSNPAWCRILRGVSCVSPLKIGTLSRCCVLGQDTLPSHASLDSGVNEYLDRDGNVCDYFLAPKWLQVLYAPKRELKWYMNEQVQ